jgi:multisubunit Na+/H+ antiporter MnhC subunit
MELDDFKLMKPAEGATDREENEPLKTDDMNTLINQLKEADTKDKKALFLIIIIFFVFIGVYLSTSLTKHGELRDAYSMLILGFAMALLYMFSGLLKTRRVDYTEPACIFLRKALKRHKFMKPIDWILTLPIIAIFFAGGFLIVRHSFMKYMDNTLMPEIIFIAVFVAAVTVGGWAGYQKWKEKKAPLVEEIRRKLKEFGQE